jgi:hypothetical protein
MRHPRRQSNSISSVIFDPTHVHAGEELATVLVLDTIGGRLTEDGQRELLAQQVELNELITTRAGTMYISFGAGNSGLFV